MQSVPRSPALPNLRLVEPETVPERAPASLRAWITLFGALSFSAGHGLFLLTALTKLAKLPGARELGSPPEIAVLAWFVAAMPLALASVVLRTRFQRLSSLQGWSLAAGALGLTLVAFTFYLRAIALA